MRTRSFGTTDLRCSEIGFGTWALGSNWWGTVTSGEGVNLIRRAIDLGITFFDTGDVYGKGANEEIVASALEGVPRESVQLSTKFGYALDERRQEHSQGERPQDWSPEPCPHSAGGQPAAARHRLRGPLPAAQPAHGRDRARRPVRGAGASARRGQAAPLRRGAGSGDRLAGRGSARARRAQRRRHSRRSTTCWSSSRGATSSRRPGASGAGVMARVPTSSGLLEDKYTLETTFPATRPSQPPPTRVARRWAAEGRAAALPVRGARVHDGPGSAEVHPRPGCDRVRSAHGRQSRGPRGVGSRLGRARPHRRGPRADRRALRAQLRRRARRARASAGAGRPGSARALRCPWPAARS